MINIVDNHQRISMSCILIIISYNNQKCWTDYNQFNISAHSGRSFTSVVKCVVHKCNHIYQPLQRDFSNESKGKQYTHSLIYLDFSLQNVCNTYYCNYKFRWFDELKLFSHTRFPYVVTRISYEYFYFFVQKVVWYLKHLRKQRSLFLSLWIEVAFLWATTLNFWSILVIFNIVGFG